MSNTPPHPARPSPEGLLLIKSFAGFRPQAVRRRDGVLIIGYGHSKTARPGVTITEADAELLLLYDLIPVIEAIHTHVKQPLNQPQFDALTSFILSIGIERFTRSDVLDHLNLGQTAEAARALSGWPDKVPPPIDAPYRRRSAERALFESAQDQPPGLGDLLIAPVTPHFNSADQGASSPTPATIPVLHHEPQQPPRRDAADYGALVFTGAVGALAVAAGLIAFQRQVSPVQPTNHSLWVGAGLVIAGTLFIAAAAWNLLHKQNNKLVI